MELKILKKKEFPLLNKERVNVDVSYPNEATPKKDDIKTSVVSLLGVDSSLVHVKHIYPRFGERKAKAIVNVYKDVESLNVFDKKKEKKAKAAK